MSLLTFFSTPEFLAGIAVGLALDELARQVLTTHLHRAFGLDECGEDDSDGAA